MDLILVKIVDADDDNKEYEAELTPAQIEEVSNDETKYMNLLKSLKEAHALKPSTSSTSNEVRSEVQNRWTNKTIKLLLELRLGMETKFMNPTVKKIKLWDIIAKKMLEHGVVINANDCYAKYRNLLQTYRHNKDKRLKNTGESAVTWEYFDTFDHVLGCKASSCPAEDLLSSSIPDTSAIEQEQRQQLQPKKKRKQELSVASYLYHKTERDERRDSEKKRLKEKEIEAINNLADAIRFAVSGNTSNGNGPRQNNESDSD